MTRTTRTTLVPTRPFDPFAGWETLDTFDTLVRRAFGPGASEGSDGSGTRTGFQPAAEVARDGDDAIVRLELPGLDIAKDVEVEVSGRRLVVRGERRDESSDERRGYREFRYGSFARSFRLPAHVTAQDVTASYDAGVLTLRVAGANASTPAQRIAINTGSASATEPTAEGVASTERTEGTGGADGTDDRDKAVEGRTDSDGTAES